jgi:hypothetical protein
MNSNVLKTSSIFLLGAAVGGAIVAKNGAVRKSDVVFAQTKKPLTISHIYVGPDGQALEEEIPVDFTNNGFKLLPVSGAEIHRASPGGTPSWHPMTTKQYVITLRGEAEMEVSGGKKITIAPGHIALMEDNVGKGHQMKLSGTDDRLAVFLPLADQGAH